MYPTSIPIDERITFQSSRGGRGGYGDMPTRFLVSKFEMTQIPENPLTLDMHRRSVLVDETPDPAFMAADHKRDLRGQSKLVLNLREGGTRHDPDIDPRLPDGTFLDFEFLEHDPRGVADEPNWDRYNEERKARGKYVAFYNDDDPSVPESMLNPAQMRDNIRNAQGMTASRMKIFDTAKDNFITTSNHIPLEAVLNRRAAAARSTHDGTIPHIADHPSIQHNKTTVMSNVTQIFNHSTPDHEFKVAKYGGSNNCMTAEMLKHDNFQNRILAGLSNPDVAMFQDQSVSKGLMLTMRNILQQQQARRFAADASQFRMSEQNVNSVTNPLLKPTGGASSQHAIESQAMDIARLMQDKVLRRNGQRFLTDTGAARIHQSEARTKIVEFLTKDPNKHIGFDKDELKKYIQTSNAPVDEKAEMLTKTVKMDVNPEVTKMLSAIGHHIPGQKETPNYGGLRPADSKQIQHFNGEVFGATSHTLSQAKSKMPEHLSATQEQTEEDTKFQENLGAWAYGGAPGGVPIHHLIASGFGESMNSDAPLDVTTGTRSMA